MTHEPRLPCPMCGYDLIGVFREDSTARCPECGHETNLVAVGDELERRARWWQGPLAFLVTFAALVFVSNVSGMTFADLEALDFLFALVVGVFVWLIAWWWINLNRAESVTFAIGAVASAMFDLLWNFPLLLTTWFVGFWMYSFLKEWRQVGDRY